MRVLIIGGTGTVGSQVTRNLLALGHTPRVFTSSEEHARKLQEGVEVAIGNLENPASIPPAFEGVDAVFMITPLHPQETRLGLNTVDAIRSSNCRRVVYSSVSMPPGSEKIPHFRSKIPVEDAIMDSGREYTILRPVNFYQNDFWIKDAILRHGLYAQPIGDVGINRLDIRDIADAAVNALLRDDFLDGIYDMGSPDVWTGDKTAQVWSIHLGREVRYMGNDLDVWAEQARKMIPEFLVHDFRIMYDFFQTCGFIVPEEAFEPQRKILGHAPRSFEEFVAETARQWKTELAGAGLPSG